MRYDIRNDKSNVPKGHHTFSLFTITYYFPKIAPKNLVKSE